MIKKLHSGKRASSVVATLVLIIGGIFCIFPLLWMIRSSFMSKVEIFIIPMKWLPNKWQFSNFVDAFTRVDFPRYYLNSFLICAITVFFGTLTASLCAYSFARLNWKGKNIVFSCIMASMMLPSTVTLIPLFLQWNAMGLTNSYIPLIAPAFFGGGAAQIFMMRQFYMSIPRAIDESAKIDGASNLVIWAKIMVPLTKSAIIVVGLFLFMYGWNDFMAPLIYLNDKELYTVALGLHMFTGEFTSEWNYLMAASTIAVIPVLIVFLFGQKYFVEGIALSGIKG